MSQTVINDEFWMRKALDAAREAQERDEIPIGACIVFDEENSFVTAGNSTIADSDPTAHAEIIALRAAGKLVKNYRIENAVIYSTVEPCAMCAGALVNARVKRLVYGTADERFGAVRTKFEICDSADLNHRIEITTGVLEDECRALIQSFFKAKRDAVKMLKRLKSESVD